MSQRVQVFPWIRQLGSRFSPFLNPNIGIRGKMAILVVIGSVSLISLFAYLGTTALRENTQNTLQERVLLAQITARHIDYLLANIENSLTATAAEDDWTEFQNTDLAMDQAFRRLNFFTKQIFLIDSNGQSIAAYPPVASPVSFNEFASVAAVLNGQNFAVSRFKRPLGLVDPSTVASVPVRDNSGNIIGALALCIDLTGPNFHAFTKPVGLGETGYMDLVDLGGAILASTRPERVGQESDHGESLRGMILNRRQTVSQCHDCHTTGSGTQPQQEVLAFAPLDHAQWGVTVRQSEDEVFAMTHLLRTRIFALLAINLAGAMVLVYLVSRNFIRPVQALIAATKRISAGDLDTPLEMQRRDEFGNLARSFDAMRTRLKESMEEIQAWNHTLDRRVQEQTSACREALKKNKLLYQELQKKEKSRGVLLRRVISAQEEERKRISRELHDETCQMLTAMAYTLDNAEDVTNPLEMHKLLEQMRSMTETTQQELQRIIMDLRPTMLDYLGLIPALRWYIENRLSNLKIHPSIRVVGRLRPLEPIVEITFFRVVQEAVNNIAQHSQAKHADFVFEFFNGSIEARISDDGVGFDINSLKDESDENRGLGLMGMAERMSTIGGDFKLQSTPGKGTDIRLILKREGLENV